MKHCHRVAALALVFAVAGCGGRDPSSEPSPLPPAVSAVLDAAPREGAPTPIPEARARLRPGDPVLIEGRIMGRPSPFVQQRAAFVLGDETTLTPCSQRPGDGCPTPWDLCCDPPEAIRSGTASIQIVDATGAVARMGLRGVRGLRELSRVRVDGVVAAGSSPDALIVNARAIAVLP